MSLLASGAVVSPLGFDFRQLFRHLDIYSWMPDGDDDKEEEESEEEEDDEEQDDESGDGSKDKKETTKDPERKRLSEEAKRHRLAKRAAEKERDEAKARVKELEDKDKDGNEKLQAEVEELKKFKADTEPILKDQALKIGFYESGVAAKFQDSDIAYRILDFSEVEVEDGVADVEAIEELAETLLKKKPHLAASGDEKDKDKDDGDNEDKTSGRPSNGKKSKGKTTDFEALATKFPALRR